VYVIDTNSVRVMGNYYPETFPTFWDHVSELVAAGRLLSVREVRKELDGQNTAAHVAAWVATNSGLFTAPAPQEMTHVASIFAVPHFQQMIGEKQRLRGYPVADPWLVARGMEFGAIVVSEEEAKPNSAKIPNVCEHFSVECIPLQELLRREGWRY
jgi:hypothetical protein